MRKKETRFRKCCSITWCKKFDTLDPLPHTFNSGTYYIKQEYVKKNNNNKVWWNIKLTWEVWLIANLIAISTRLLWCTATPVLIVIEWNLFCWARAPVHSNCQGDDLGYSDSFLIYRKQPPRRLFHTELLAGQGALSSLLPSHRKISDILSKHTLTNECISSPRANTLCRFGRWLRK